MQWCKNHGHKRPKPQVSHGAPVTFLCKKRTKSFWCKEGYHFSDLSMGPTGQTVQADDSKGIFRALGGFPDFTQCRDIFSLRQRLGCERGITPSLTYLQS